VILDALERKRQVAFTCTEPGIRPPIAGRRMANRGALVGLCSASEVEAGELIRVVPRQLHQIQASEGAGLAVAPSALDLLLRPDLSLLAQRGREVLLWDDPPMHPHGGFCSIRGSADRHERTSGRAQCWSQAIRLGQTRRRSPRYTQPSPCSFCLSESTSDSVLTN